MYESNRMKWLIGKPVFPRAGFSNVRMRTQPNTSSAIMAELNLPNSFGTYTGRTFKDTKAPKGVEQLWLEVQRASGRIGWVRYDMIIANEKAVNLMKDNQAVRLLWNIVETDKKTFKRLLIMREDLENPKFKKSAGYADAKRQYTRVLASYNARQTKMQTDRQLLAKASNEPSGLEKLGKKWSSFLKDNGIGGHEIGAIPLVVIAVIGVLALISGVSIAYIISTYQTDLTKATEDDITSQNTLEIFNKYIAEATTPAERAKRTAVVKKAKVELVADIQNAQDEGEHSGKTQGAFGNLSTIAIIALGFKLLA